MKNNNTDTCTIYLLKNKVTNKIYVGQTWMRLEDRMGSKGERYSNSPYLFASIQKHGVENFEYSILATTQSQKEADELEIKFINEYNSLNHYMGYNIKEGGRGGKHSEESKNKISETLLHTYSLMTEEQKRGRASSIIGWWEGKERGPHTEEWKDKNSEMMIKWHAENEHPLQGTFHSDKTKDKISIGVAQAWIDNKYPQESINKRALAQQMSTEREDQIIELYNKNVTFAEIRKLMNVGNGAVYRILERRGIPKREEKNDWSNRKHSAETKEKMAKTARQNAKINKLSENEKSAIIESYIDGLSFDKMNKLHKVTFNVIYELIDAAGLPRRSTGSK